MARLPAVAITFRVLDIVQTGPVFVRWRQSSRGVQLNTRLCLEKNLRMREVLFIYLFTYLCVPCQNPVVQLGEQEIARQVERSSYGLV